MSNRKPIISARRTENLEALLQKLWTLRPMYRNKQAFTITAGVAALIREIEDIDSRSGRSTVATSQASAVEAEQPIETMAVDERSDAIEEEVEAESVSDDIEW